MSRQVMSRRNRLGDILLRTRALDEAQLRTGLERQEREGGPLGLALVKLGYLSEDVLVTTLADQLRLPVAKIRDWRIHPELLELIPPDLAQKHRCLPLFLKEGGPTRMLYVTLADPADEQALEEIRRHCGMDVRPVLVSPSELEEGLESFYGLRSRLSLSAPAAEQPAPSALVEPDEERLEPVFDRWAVTREEIVSLIADPQPRGTGAPPDARLLVRRIEELDQILHTLVQLLLDDRVLSREELVARLRALRDSRC